MFNVNGSTNEITLTAGDTGSFDVTVTGIEFGVDDRAVWTVKDGTGAKIFERYYEITNGGFVVVFTNSDTDSLPAGQYSWDMRFVVAPIWEDGRIVDGTIVNTPGGPFNLIIKAPVGEV